MNCHQCPHHNNLAAGAFKDLPFDKTPCAKCQLEESSAFTMEFDDSRATAQPDPPDEGAHLMPATQDEAVSKFRPAAEAILQLPRKTRDMVFWRLAGMTYQDIAHLEGNTVAAVEVRHSRAIDQNPALATLFAEKLRRAKGKAITRHTQEANVMNPHRDKIRGLQSEARLIRAWIREVTAPKYRRLIRITADLNELTGARQLARPSNSVSAKRFARTACDDTGELKNKQ